MGHTEVAKTPAKAGDHVFPVAEEVPIALGQLCHGGGSLTALNECQREDRCDQQGCQHQHTLEEVGPAHGGEAAQEGIADDDKGC